MEFFLDYLKENEQLRRTLDRLSENQKFQGSTIRFSDEFLWFLQLRKTFDSDNIRNMFRDFSEGYLNPFYWYRRYGMTVFGWGEEDLVAPALSYHEFRQFRDEFKKELEIPGIKPILITLCVFNDANMAQFQESIYNLDELRYSGDIRFSIERRNRNMLYNSRDKHDPVVGGISIGKIKDEHFGTLGGMLESTDGVVYGLTCSHVAGSGDEVVQPAMVENGTNDSIGPVVHQGPMIWDKSCNEHVGSKCYDIALIEIRNRPHQQKIHKLGPVRQYRKFRDLSSGMKVEFNGRTTNKRKILYAGSLCLSYKVGIDMEDETRYACFNNLIELRDKPFKLFGMICLSNGEPVLPGDSGAWVCSNDSSGYSWCGMIMSGDIDRGYFIGAEHILNYLGSQGYHFTIQPL